MGFCFRSSAIPHKGGSSIPLPGSALPSRRCPPDKVRPVASSSRATSPALSMIPRGPPSSTQISSPYQTSPNSQQKNSMLDKLKLFKSNETKPIPSTNGKRTSSSSGVSSARSERSDSSASLEPTTDVKPLRNVSRLKQTRSTQKPALVKNSSPTVIKKDNPTTSNKTGNEMERHAHKVANLTKLGKIGSTKQISMVTPGTGIPKPTAAVKGTSKVAVARMSRENSQTSITVSKPAVALVSPMKHELSESSHSASTGQHSNSSESSVIYKPSSESSCEHNVIPNRKEPISYISEIPEPNQDDKTVINSEICDNLNILEEKKLFPSLQNEEETTTLSIEPMRPLLRGYCSTLNLPSRSRVRVQPEGASEYCEIAIANGYLSDGEMLQNVPQRDMSDGYMSEGGSVLYARRLQTLPAHIPNG